MANMFEKMLAAMQYKQNVANQREELKLRQTELKGKEAQMELWRAQAQEHLAKLANSGLLAAAIAGSGGMQPSGLSVPEAGGGGGGMGQEVPTMLQQPGYVLPAGGESPAGVGSGTQPASTSQADPWASIPPDVRKRAGQAMAAGYATLAEKMLEPYMNVLEMEQKRETLAKTRAETKKLEREQTQLPQIKYGLGNDIDAKVYELFGQQIGPTGMPSPAQVGIANEALKQEKLQRSREAQAVGLNAVAQRTFDAAVAKPIESVELLNRMNMLMNAEDIAKTLTTEFTPEERARYVGLGGLRKTKGEVDQLMADATGGTADPKFARFSALNSLAASEAFSTAGKALTEAEKDIIFGYIPTGKEMTAAQYEAKLKLTNERLPTTVSRELKLMTTQRGQLPTLREQGKLPRLPSATVAPAPAAPAATPAQGAAPAKSDTPAQAEVRKKLKALGMTDVEIDKELGR